MVSIKNPQETEATELRI